MKAEERGRAKGGGRGEARASWTLAFPVRTAVEVVDGALDEVIEHAEAAVPHEVLLCVVAAALQRHIWRGKGGGGGLLTPLWSLGCKGRVEIGGS